MVRVDTNHGRVYSNSFYGFSRFKGVGVDFIISQSEFISTPKVLT